MIVNYPSAESAPNTVPQTPPLTPSCRASPEDTAQVKRKTTPRKLYSIDFSHPPGFTRTHNTISLQFWCHIIFH